MTIPKFDPCPPRTHQRHPKHGRASRLRAGHASEVNGADPRGVGETPGTGREPAKLKQPEKIGAAAERLLQRNHGYRYYSWDIHQGGFRFFENEASLAGEKSIEGKYVIATSESGLSVLDVVAIYKDLSDLERGFRQLKDEWQCGRSIIRSSRG